MLEKILVFDTETTGFRSDDEVLTLAVVNGAGKALVDGMYAPVRKSTWPDAEKINRISPKMVAECPPILSQQKLLEQMFNDPEVLLVGYNIEFDIRLLAQSGIRITNPNRHDVMLAFSEFRKVPDARRGGYRWWKLTECADYYRYDWGTSEAHGALADTLATLYCYQKMQQPVYEEQSLF